MTSRISTETEITPHTQNLSAATLADIELLPQGTGARSEDLQTHSLPPTDGGKDAWLYLFSCFMLEAMIWGERKAYPHSNITNMSQASHQHMEYFKSTTPLTNLLDLAISPLLVPALWASCTWTSLCGSCSSNAIRVFDHGQHQLAWL
jgi:hypothetical protein